MSNVKHIQKHGRNGLLYRCVSGEVCVMSELKMSDYFTQNFKPSSMSVNSTHHTECVGGISTNWGRSHIKAALHAINNHDRLVEENKELREALREIEKACSDNWEKSGFSERVEDIAHEALNKKVGNL